jgi:hypothetical protein
VPLGIQLVDDVPRLQGDGFECDVIFPGEVVEAIVLDVTRDKSHFAETGRFVRLEADDGSTHLRVSEGRPIS